MEAICLNNGTSQADAVSSVVSDKGLVLSPKNAPEITAPAAIPTGIPSPAAVGALCT